MAKRPEKPTPSTLQRPLSHAVMDLHRALIQAEARASGLDGNPYKLLTAVMQDPRFAWLRSFSDLIVAMDEAGDRGELPDRAALTPYLVTLRGLIAPSHEAGARIAALVPKDREVSLAFRKIEIMLGEFSA
ncbi:hypothetical protein [Acidisoma sp. C75]